MPKVDKSTGTAYEPIDWRPDYLCGKESPADHAFSDGAKCNHPYKGDQVFDQLRCCKDGMCQADDVCECDTCEGFHASIDSDLLIQMANQFSLHTGIVNFWPLMFGQFKQEERVNVAMATLFDPAQMSSLHGIRSLSA